MEKDNDMFRRDILMSLSEIRALVRVAFHRGFEESAEGFNAEYPGMADAAHTETFVSAKENAVSDLADPFVKRRKRDA